MRKLKAEGRTILFISHKLEEVMKCSDVITVMRAGRVVANTTVAMTSIEALARAMVGDNVPKPLIESHALPTGETLLDPRRRGQGSGRIRAAWAAGSRYSPGEISAWRALEETDRTSWSNARREFCRLSRRHSFAGADLTNASAARLRRAGIGYVSADRRHEGLCLAAALTENFIAGREHDRAFSRSGFLRGANIRSEAAESVRGGLACATAHWEIRRQSLRRQPAAPGDLPRTFARAETPRGRATHAWSRHRGLCVIHNLIVDFRDGGGAVLLVSKSLDEILALSDRIVCLFNGQIIGALNRADASVETVGRMMLGRRRRHDADRSAPVRQCRRCSCSNRACSRHRRRCPSGGRLRTAWRLSPHDPGGFWRPAQIAATLTAATPLLLTGLAAAVAFRAGIFNVARGLLYLGGIVAAVIGCAAPTWPSFVLILIALAAASLAAGSGWWDQASCVLAWAWTKW